MKVPPLYGPEKARLRTTDIAQSHFSADGLPGQRERAASHSARCLVTAVTSGG